MTEEQKERKRQYMKEYRKRNSERIKEYNSGYYKRLAFAREMLKSIEEDKRG